LITTWDRVRQLARERFPEDDEEAARDVVEAVEVAVAAEKAETAAREAASQEHVAKEEVEATAREAASQEEVDEDDVDGLEGFDDKAASDDQRALVTSFKTAQRDESVRRLMVDETRALTDILDERAAGTAIRQAVVDAQAALRQAESRRWREDMDMAMDG
jgi:hypothetical protein